GVVGTGRDQTRHLRPAVAGVPHGRAPDVPVLRRERGARLRGVAADVGPGRGLGADDGAPRAGSRPRLCLALDRGPADAGPVARVPVALVAARARARAGVGAVPRPAVVAGHLRAVLGPEPGLSRHGRVRAGP